MIFLFSVVYNLLSHDIIINTNKTILGLYPYISVAKLLKFIVFGKKYLVFEVFFVLWLGNGEVACINYV